MTEAPKNLELDPFPYITNITIAKSSWFSLFQPLGFFNPGAAVLPGHSPGRIHGAGGHGGHGHPLSVPGAPQPGCVHHVCWKEEEHHGDGGRIILDQGGGGGRVHIGAANCGVIPDLAGEIN